MQREWEFVRRFMEEGPKELLEQVEVCLPIADKREGFLYGMVRLFANFTAVPVMMWMLSPILFLASFTRWFAMRTSKLPLWPVEVQAACPVVPNDPYVKDSRINPPRYR